jgi:hypothetical protein
MSWQFKIDAENGEWDYFGSHYFAYKDDAISDYKRRTEDYKSKNKVEEVK